MTVYVSLVWFGLGSSQVVGVSRTLTNAKSKCNVKDGKWNGAEPRWTGQHAIEPDMVYTIVMSKLEG
jgi:hypothetical protein